MALAIPPHLKSENSQSQELAILDNVALRSGELSFDGWLIKPLSVVQILRTGRALAPTDFVPDLKQKHIDMKIGLDIAWLASKRIVERIVLITADSDFVPAMKFARREGVQVVLVTMGHTRVKRELKVHADELRSVVYP
ncbi:MAG TPA: NYN domain-containing protein [Pyrinomonadaceae bacterium]|nr:NYN domain-containing protein [Pyrinomonadaceae bacterium]